MCVERPSALFELEEWLGVARLEEDTQPPVSNDDIFYLLSSTTTYRPTEPTDRLEASDGLSMRAFVCPQTRQLDRFSRDDSSHGWTMTRRRGRGRRRVWFLALVCSLFFDTVSLSIGSVLYMDSTVVQYYACVWGLFIPHVACLASKLTRKLGDDPSRPRRNRFGHRPSPPLLCANSER